MTIPVFRVFDYAKAMAFYVEWLGFKIEWEQKPDDGPFQVRLSLREVTLHLVEHADEGSLGTWVIVPEFKHLIAYRKIICPDGGKFPKPELRKVPREPNSISMTVVDPFFNRIEFREAMR
jgi:hypothetical protein